MSGKRRYSLTKNSTKKCSKCGQYKNVAEFGWINKKKGYKAPECRECKKRIMTAFYDKRKAPFFEYLKMHSCVDCGFSDYRALEFDHVRGEKEYNVSQMWSLPGTDKQRQALFDVEVAKCDIRCRNCHVIRHFKDGWGGGRKIASKDAIEFYKIPEEDKEPELQMSLFS